MLDTIVKITSHLDQYKSLTNLELFDLKGRFDSIQKLDDVLKNVFVSSLFIWEWTYL